MAQDDILYLFYMQYLKDPSKFMTVRDVSKELGLNYASAYKQVRALWFFNWLTLRYKDKKKNKYYVINGIATYRINTNKVARLKLMYSYKKSDCQVSDISKYNNINVYESSFNMMEKIGSRCLNGRL